MLRKLFDLLPKNFRTHLLGVYHLAFALAGSFLYGNPSKKLTIIGVTGTKGKSSTAEMIYRILTESGKKVALTGTVHFYIGEQEEKNLFKMSMPGRFFIQRFLSRAVNAGCTHAVIEMTSEGARQHRHRGISMDALVFTNLSPEHIESHGSFEKYAEAKLSIAKHLARSTKRPRIIVANEDDSFSKQFLSTPVEVKRPFSITDAEIASLGPEGSVFTYKNTEFNLKLAGAFNIANALGAIEVCSALGIPLKTSAVALASLTRIAGRAERVLMGQPFEVVVDYAHTPDSLKAVYEAFSPQAGGHRICVLGNTGGGRDTWKRSVMGSIADHYCDMAYLTDEDSYDENLEDILHAMREGFVRITPKVVLDRRQAIKEAFGEAKQGDVVLITGKGTDPYIMGPRGTKVPWSDFAVAKEELEVLLGGTKRSH